MGQLGLPELIIIGIIALLIFGPKKLPDLGAGLGKAIRDFKGAIREDSSQDEKNKEEKKERKEERRKKEKETERNEKQKESRTLSHMTELGQKCIFDCAL